MKLLVLGATGDIGEAVLQAAVTAGHDVTAFVRSPDKLGDVRDRLQVIKGDLTDAAAVASAMTGTDAVISAIGSSPDRAQLDAPATAVRLILAAMGSAGVRRFVGLAGGAVNVPGEWKPLSGRITTALVRLLARNVVEAKQREFEVVSRSDLDWTMVRPPRVVAGEPTGRVEIGPKLHGFQVTRGDLATAMVTLATGSDWLRQAPYVSESRQR
ncbi:MAG: NAD(P)H-binding protein [Chloroflexota bacterium]|jgi:putative NADH-flavin reductase|nr:NAD(P)H-binding protein [Chloroflexota bacterium]